MTGRHRDPNALTGPLRLRPSRQQLVDIPGDLTPVRRWDGPDRRRLTPADAWSPAVVSAPPRPTVPPPGEVDSETTGQFSLAELGEATGSHLIPADLVSWLAKPDPAPVDEPFSTGPIRLPAERRTDEPESVLATALIYGLTALAVLLFAVIAILALAPGGA